MLVTLVRAFIIYLVVTAIMRLMGKREIGQLQPTELIIMLLISELVTIPLEDNEIPLMNSLAAVAVLAFIEIAVSAVSLKSKKFRSVMQGNPVIIIREGIIDQKQMKELRMTVDDLLFALRQKDVFDIESVQYAIIESSGAMSVLLKSSARAVSVCEAGIEPANDSYPALIIADGKLNESALKTTCLSPNKLEEVLKKENATVKDIFLMTADNRHNLRVIKKQNI